MAGRGRTRRANAPGGPRSKRVVVKLTEEELERLEAKAIEQGVTVQGLMVAAALSDRIESVTERRQVGAALMSVQRLVGNSADNMNQVARYANTVRDVPSDFASAMRQARATWDQVDVVLEQLVELNRKAGA